MKPFKVVCRGSLLSLAQAGIFKTKLVAANPGVQVEIIVKETEGDRDQIQPLSEMEGRDFFTKDIQDVLLQGNADFAVHSLKDVSGEAFFKNNTYAIVEREDPRDVAIFHQSTPGKIAGGAIIKLGTSSPRRAEMATAFLSKALPVLNGKMAAVEAVPIRGNVDTRLQKLDRNEYDGIVLACAGLNRLLRSEVARSLVSGLLRNKKIVVLPLIECPPAPGQGAIVAETSPENEAAIKALQAINDQQLSAAVIQERSLANKYGSGCHQKFGVIHVQTDTASFTYASGKDRSGNFFTEVHPPAAAWKQNRGITAVEAESLLRERQLLVVNAPVQSTTHPSVWVPATETWFDLARQGTWVMGSAEGWGSGFLNESINSPLIAHLLKIQSGLA